MESRESDDDTQAPPPNCRFNFNVQNSVYFREKIKNVSVEGEEVMVSFDVKFAHQWLPFTP